MRRWVRVVQARPRVRRFDLVLDRVGGAASAGFSVAKVVRLDEATDRVAAGDRAKRRTMTLGGVTPHRRSPEDAGHP